MSHNISHDWNVRRPKLGISPERKLSFDVRCGDGSIMTVYADEDTMEKLMLALLDVLLETS